MSHSNQRATSSAFSSYPTIRTRVYISINNFKKEKPM